VVPAELEELEVVLALVELEELDDVERTSSTSSTERLPKTRTSSTCRRRIRRRRSAWLPAGPEPERGRMPGEVLVLVAHVDQVLSPESWIPRFLRWLENTTP
jgi:hypothetical protein